MNPFSFNRQTQSLNPHDPTLHPLVRNILLRHDKQRRDIQKKYSNYRTQLKVQETVLLYNLDSHIKDEIRIALNICQNSNSQYLNNSNIYKTIPNNLISTSVNRLNTIDTSNLVNVNYSHNNDNDNRSDVSNPFIDHQAKVTRTKPKKVKKAKVIRKRKNSINEANFNSIVSINDKNGKENEKGEEKPTREKNGTNLNVNNGVSRLDCNVTNKSNNNMIDKQKKQNSGIEIPTNKIVISGKRVKISNGKKESKPMATRRLSINTSKSLLKSLKSSRTSKSNKTSNLTNKNLKLNLKLNAKNKTKQLKSNSKYENRNKNMGNGENENEKEKEKKKEEERVEQSKTRMKQSNQRFEFLTPQLSQTQQISKKLKQRKTKKRRSMITMTSISISSDPQASKQAGKRRPPKKLDPEMEQRSQEIREELKKHIIKTDLLQSNCNSNDSQKCGLKCKFCDKEYDTEAGALIHIGRHHATDEQKIHECDENGCNFKGALKEVVSGHRLQNDYKKKRNSNKININDIGSGMGKTTITESNRNSNSNSNSNSNLNINTKMANNQVGIKIDNNINTNTKQGRNNNVLIAKKRNVSTRFKHFGKKSKNISARKENVATFDCKTCGKHLNSRVEWRKHQDTHKAVRPLICNQCQKKFANENMLLDHKRLVHNLQG